MKAEKAVPRLAEMVKDHRQEVRRAALVALGLVDSPASREYLTNPGTAEAMDTMAWIAAVMMLETPSEDMFRVLGRLVKDTRSEHVQWMAAWALRTFKPEGYLKLLYPMLKDTPSVLLASEIVLAIGENRDPEDLNLLMLIAEARLEGNELKVMRMADAVKDKPDGMGTDNSSIRKTKPTLRAAAVMALEQYADFDPTDPRMTQPRRGLRRNIIERPAARMSTSYGARALLALAEIGEEEDRDFATSYISAEMYPVKVKGWLLNGIVYIEDVVNISGSVTGEDHVRYHPARGFAAIAFGKRLGASNVDGLEETDQAFRDHERLMRRGTRKLGVYLNSKVESGNFRAACAMALGLSGDKQATPVLVDALANLGQGDELIIGHCILALAMLGEPAALEAALKFFGPAGSPDIKTLLEKGMQSNLTLSQSVGGRAAALGVALMGDVRAAPMLTHHWGRDPWVSLEAARTAGWLGDYKFSETLVEMIKQKKQPGLALLAARSLGEMYDPGRPSRLSRLVSNTNYNHQQAIHSLKDTRGVLIYNKLYPRKIDGNIPALANPLFYLYMQDTGRNLGG